MQRELIQLGVAIVVILLVLLVLRRASSKSRAKADIGARGRLGLEEPTGQKQRKRPIKSAKTAERVEEPEEVEADLPTDAETAAAYKAGLAKTRGGFVAKIGKLFGKKQIDATTVEELEEVLFTADIGPRAADRIFQSVKTGLSKADLENPTKIWKQIRKTSRDILAVDSKPFDLAAHKPFVLLILGVNGVGKTTTIGKLAKKWSLDGKKVLLAAGDTFRA
ncbi:MAG TPA: signal recognition particle receptor subunit alpha, partial [Kofleriaceae bacterium]|nr:signal recognition particle receptor subunit alpha [Kofleriaceae bacterium]